MIQKEDLEQALRLQQIGVVYQPLIDLRNGVCVGAEALVRWHRGDGQTLSPDSFIPAAEQLQCTDLITARIVDLVIAELGTVLTAQPGLHVAINICPDELRNGQTLDLIERKLADHQIHPSQIWLEITESMPLPTSSARQNLSSARNRGHQIAIDDFGMGYANFRSLRDLPCDVLKIDRSFIADLGEDSVSQLILGCILDLANLIGLQVVVEGVETAMQVEKLRSAGVQFAQGWYFSKAIAAAEFIDFLKRGSV